MWAQSLTFGSLLRPQQEGCEATFPPQLLSCWSQVTLKTVHSVLWLSSHICHYEPVPSRFSFDCFHDSPHSWFRGFSLNMAPQFLCFLLIVKIVFPLDFVGSPLSSHPISSIQLLLSVAIWVFYTHLRQSITKPTSFLSKTSPPVRLPFYEQYSDPLHVSKRDELGGLPWHIASLFHPYPSPPNHIRLAAANLGHCLLLFCTTISPLMSYHPFFPGWPCFFHCYPYKATNHIPVPTLCTFALGTFTNLSSFIFHLVSWFTRLDFLCLLEFS